jgi:protein-S-isoprenylcysteine O-methyltransferase Ste14
MLQPGLVAGLFPYWILGDLFSKAFAEPFYWQKYIAILVFVAGFLVMIYCILQFAVEGHGTLSPIDPTKKLVINGLYKFSRNPMYVGVILMLIGETMFFTSRSLLGYSVFIFLCFHLFVNLVEEPRLRRDFSAEYSIYCKKVRRWI